MDFDVKVKDFCVKDFDAEGFYVKVKLVPIAILAQLPFFDSRPSGVT